jgi:hypothetical protein
MTSKKQKDRKKQKRKNIAKIRVLARRKELRETLKKERQDQLRFDTEYELKNGKKQPFIKNIDPERERIKNENIKKKLEHNMKIVEALEQEYLAEEQKRLDALESSKKEENFEKSEKDVDSEK